MSKKYFIKKDSEMTSTLEEVKGFIRFNNLVSLDVFEAIREKESDYFFCRDAWSVGEKGECGSGCKSYKPRNGKSGICRHNRPVYFRGETLNIKL